MVEREQAEPSHLQELLGSIPGVVWQAWGEPDAANQRIDYVSNYVESMLGYSVDEWLKTPNFWLSIVHPDDRERAAAVAAATFESDAVGTNEFRWITKDGRALWVRAHSTTVRDESGTALGMRGVTLDITEAKRFEQRLRVQDDVLRTLSEGISLGQVASTLLESICETLEWDLGAVWRVEPSSRMLHNVAIWQRPGLDAEEFVSGTRAARFERGQGLPGQVWSNPGALWMSDVRREHNFPRATLAAGAGLRAALAFPIVSTNDVLGVVEFFSRDLREPDAELSAITAHIGRQIGQFIERTEAVAALAESETRRAEIIRSALDAVIVMDSAAVISEWNPQAERLFGWSAAEAIGKRLSTLIIPERHRDAHERGLRHFLETGEGPVIGTRIELEGLHRSGREFPLELSVAAAKLAGGSAFSAFVRDISDRRIRERMREDFVAFASHELRSPLTTVRGMSKWLERSAQSNGARFDQDQRDAIETLSEESERMVKIVEIFLDLTRIQSGRFELEFVPTDVVGLVQAETDAVQRRHRGITIDVVCVAPSLVIETDPDRLAQVISNLMENAAKYGGTSPAIQVQTTSSGDQVTIRVSDHGVGIPLEDQPYIFDRFYRGRSAETSGAKGLGIGLFITRQVVEALGGRISFESIPGAGTSFIVTLPARHSE